MILVYTCRHTTTCVCSYCNVHVYSGVRLHGADGSAGRGDRCSSLPGTRRPGPALLLFFFPSMDVGTYILIYMCPHTTVYVSSYHYVCVSHVGCADTSVMILFVIDAVSHIGCADTSVMILFVIDAGGCVGAR